MSVRTMTTSDPTAFRVPATDSSHIVRTSTALPVSEISVSSRVAEPMGIRSPIVSAAPGSARNMATASRQINVAVPASSTNPMKSAPIIRIRPRLRWSDPDSTVTIEPCSARSSIEPTKLPDSAACWRSIVRRRRSSTAWSTRLRSTSDRISKSSGSGGAPPSAMGAR